MWNSMQQLMWYTEMHTRPCVLWLYPAHNFQKISLVAYAIVNISLVYMYP